MAERTLFEERNDSPGPAVGVAPLVRAGPGRQGLRPCNFVIQLQTSRQTNVHTDLSLSLGFFESTFLKTGLLGRGLLNLRPRWRKSGTSATPGRSCFNGANIGVSLKKAALQMLDAAHGESVSTIIAMQRVHVACIEPKESAIGIAGSIGSRRPVVAIRTDTRQCSRLAVAVARSRRMKQSLG